MKIVVTGWAGFIGSNLTRMLLDEGHEVLGIDCMTYAARPEWVELKHGNNPKFTTANIDIRFFEPLLSVLREANADAIYHLAAESHVCNSIKGPRMFVDTNVMGTFNLIEALRQLEFKGRLVHVSTDETFGELEHDDEPFHEKTPIDPRSPYSASKAASDLLVRAYVRTYGLDAVITRCTNNFGPNQHPEKLIPKAITNWLNGEAMTLHGDGSHIRDWIFVLDHCSALMDVMRAGMKGEIYCIGSGLELSNKEVMASVINAMREELGFKGPFAFTHNNDRPTDDKRYAVSTGKITRHTGWCSMGPKNFMAHLRGTVRWYAENQS